MLKPGGLFVVVEPWLTPFLRLAHAACESPARRLWERLDALATMIDYERDTYTRWLANPDFVRTQLTRRVSGADAAGAVGQGGVRRPHGRNAGALLEAGKPVRPEARRRPSPRVHQQVPAGSRQIAVVRFEVVRECLGYASRSPSTGSCVEIAKGIDCDSMSASSPASASGSVRQR